MNIFQRLTQEHRQMTAAIVAAINVQNLRQQGHNQEGDDQPGDDQLENN